jgi:outer membrane protein assembly factor BamA
MKILLLAAMLAFGQAQTNAPVIRSIKYEGFKGVSMDDVISRLRDRGVRVAVEQMYDPAQVDTARTVLQELLTEKGRKGVEVKSSVRRIPPASVEVVFEAVKK